MYRKIILSVVLFMILIGIVAILLGCNKMNDAERCYKKLMNEMRSENIVTKLKKNNMICVVQESEDSKSVNHNIYMARKDRNSCYIYETGTVVNDICMNEEYVYYADTTHDGDNFSYITRLSVNYKGDKSDIKRISIDNIVISHISIYGKRLYIWGFDYNEFGVYSKMYVYDNVSMKREHEIDFSDYIIDVVCDDVYDGFMYVTGRSSREKNESEEETHIEEYAEEDNNFICKINLADYSIAKIRLGDISSYIRCGRDAIYVSNYDIVLNEGKFIYKLDYEKYNVKLEKIMKYDNYEKIKSEIDILAMREVNKRKE